MRRWIRHVWFYEPLDEPGVVRLDYTKEGPFLCNKVLAHRILHVVEGEDDETPKTAARSARVFWMLLGASSFLVLLPFIFAVASGDPDSLFGQLLWLATGMGAGLLFSIIVNRLLPSGR